MGLVTTHEDDQLKKAGNAIRFKVNPVPSVMEYSSYRQGEFCWAAQEGVQFLECLVNAWRNELSKTFNRQACIWESARREDVSKSGVEQLRKKAVGLALRRPPIFLGDISRNGGKAWPQVNGVPYHKSHRHGIQIDIYYIPLPRTNSYWTPNKHIRGNAAQKDSSWEFDTFYNALLLKTILMCKPYRVLTQVPSMLNPIKLRDLLGLDNVHNIFDLNQNRIVNKPPHWDHFHIDVVQPPYMKGHKLEPRGIYRKDG